jgi:DNA-binding MarR family transcriptional regulator
VMRAALLNPDVSTAAIRRSLGVLDPAFSDVVKRTVYRGYAIQIPYPGDRRTRRLALTLPGEVAFGITASIQRELEAFAGSGSWMAETVDRIDAIGRRLATIPPAESYLDDLPIDTA